MHNICINSNTSPVTENPKITTSTHLPANGNEMSQKGNSANNNGKNATITFKNNKNNHFKNNFKYSYQDSNIIDPTYWHSNIGRIITTSSNTNELITPPQRHTISHESSTSHRPIKVKD